MRQRIPEVVRVLFVGRKILLNATLIFSLLGLFLFSCSKSETDGSEVAKELVERVKADSGSCICEPYINEYRWNNETVYVLAYRGPSCNWIPAYYNASGQQITSLTLQQTISFDEFLQQSTFVRNVWTCTGG